MVFSTAKWRLIQSLPSTGARNMAVDEAILESVIEGKSLATLRLYAWEPACLSLGYAQSVADADRATLEMSGFGLVRRPTGGRAILHGDELTYSVIGTENDPRLAGGVLESYCNLSLALLEALHLLGIPAEALEKPPNPVVPTENMTVGGSTAHALAVQNPVCFEVPSNYEITSRGKKLVGSAQARRKEGVLQHGTLLLSADLTRIIRVLKFRDEAARARAAVRLLEHATTAESAAGRIVSWGEAAAAYIQAFASVLNLELLPGELNPFEHSRADQLVIEKYANPAWTERV
jgi:lipoyl(octanoyl) transferase